MKVVELQKSLEYVRGDLELVILDEENTRFEIVQIDCDPDQGFIISLQSDRQEV